jgi:CheY-like chemotaxis protein
VRSRFASRYPREGRDPKQNREAVDHEPTATTRRRILVVDDNEDQAHSLSTLLELLGHEVKAAYDGHSAIAVAKEFIPDIALVDIGLPGLNGYDVARRLREQPELSKIFLVAQTGWGQEEDRRRTHEAGFDRHLVKPVEISAVQEILASIK